MKFDTPTLRQALGNFVTGVTIVTTKDASGQPRGLTANSFTSVSLDPPLVLVCISKTSTSHDAFSACDDFNVHILGESQSGLSSHFAGKSDDKFSQIDWYWGPNAAPVLPDVLTRLSCRVHNRAPAGDHLILIGRVQDISASCGRPLAYFRGSYAGTVDGTSAANACLRNRASC